MKKLAIIVMVGLFSTLSWAADINLENLQGVWLIIEFAGSPDSEGDRWEFKGNTFSQRFGNGGTPYDKFTIKGNILDLGYGKIKIKKFDGETMEADMGGGGGYKLVKQ